ncbi:MAG: hypothetical protein M0T79_05450 [Actinomycetota bacterium]|jgi:hypothetical protein|nr:hypothetical protein [Actinomycetota bacterium]
MTVTERGGGAKLAKTVVAGLSVFGFGGLAALAHPAATSVSGNPYFPLAVGATWTYKATSGPAAGSTVTTRVVSTRATAAGTVVNMRIASNSSVVLNAHYVVRPNGSVEFEGTAPGSTKVSLSGSGDYFIPNARQVTSCHPCAFTGTFTTKLATMSIQEHLLESVTSMGLQHIAVPAGSFTAEKLLLSMKLTGAYGGITTDSTTKFYDYLARNVGVVESGGGTVTTSVAGQTFHSSTGNEVLVKYTP